MKTFNRWLCVTLVYAVSLCANAQLVVATGPVGGTYDRMFNELRTACASTMPMTPKTTTGSQENFDLLNDNAVNGAFVQSDVVFYRDRTESVNFIKTLLAMHPEEVHVIVRAEPITVGGHQILGRTIMGKTVEFQTVSDLAQYRVGAAGGSVVTANMIRVVGPLPWKVSKYKSNDEVLAALKAKEIEAALLVGGSPLAAVAALDETYRLLPFTETMQESLRSVYRPARLSYSKLTTSPVATIATDALFLVQDYSGSAPMMEKLSALRNCAWEAIPSLQSTIGKHPKWRAVSPTNKGKWKWLEAAETPAAKAVPTKRK